MNVRKPGRSSLVVVSAAFVCLLLTEATKAQLTPVGAEFQVNTYTSDDQEDSAACAFPNGGGFVVAYESFGQDGDYDGVFARRYDASGAPVASEFQINTYTTSGQYDLDVCCRADGSFVVVWESGGQDGDDGGIFGQRFLASGSPDGAEFQVNEFTVYGQEDPAICCTGDEFVVTWDTYLDPGHALLARRFTAGGSPIGGDFQVGNHTFAYGPDPDICCHGDGAFVVAWEEYEGDGSYDSIFALRFDGDGNEVGSQFLVNTHTQDGQYDPQLCCPGDGSFIVTWNDNDDQDGDGDAVFARLYDASGTPAPPFLVNTFTSGDQEDQQICCGSDGRFVVVWESEQDGDYKGVFAQAFAANGTPIGAETQVNTYTTGDQDNPSVACTDIETCLAVWDDSVDDGDGQDGSDTGIFARLLSVSSTSVLEIPTLGGLGTLGLVTLLGGAGLWSFRRRRD